MESTMRSHVHLFLLATLGIVMVVSVVGISHIATAQAQTFPIPSTPSSYNGLAWTNPSTGVQTIMRDGGTYAVPFNVEGDTYVRAIGGSSYWGVEGDLYYISVATSSSTEIVRYLDNHFEYPLSWQRSGTYELKLYVMTPPVVMEAPWWQRPIAFLVGNVAHATYSYKPQLITTIHFTIRKASNSCVTSGSCYDNVLFIPGTEASRLYYHDSNGEHQVWEPDFHTDIPYLAMNADGTSKYKLYTKDIIGLLYGNTGLYNFVRLDQNDFEVYGGFEKFMNKLVASSTIKEWGAYPYDWRYGVRDVVNNGTLTEQPDGSIKRVYVENVLEQLASTSPTGKVTIIAHSNGGLVAKALMEKLKTDGKSSLVDKLIMIGVPQWGTPNGIGVLLHGDGGTHLLGLISYAGDVRNVVATMPGPYDLLPSSAYFSHINNPIATFSSDDVAKPFHDAFPNGITSYGDLVSFITDAQGLDSQVGDASNLNVPLALSSALVDKATATHTALDTWTPSSGTKVTSIVGWGQLTPYSYAYEASLGHRFCDFIFTVFGRNLFCHRKNQLGHTASLTEDGDDTVVAPSVAGDVGKVWYFNLSDYVHTAKISIIHRNLISSTPIQHVILELLKGKNISQSYITSTKPTATKNPLTIITGMSPINITATDVAGEVTGIVPIATTTDFYLAVHDIPNSAVNVLGEEKSISLPQGDTYSLAVDGYDTGPANIQIKEVGAQGDVTASTTIADIPVATSTKITFSLSATSTPSAVVIDFNGDGVSDATITPRVGAVTSFTSAVNPLNYLHYTETVIGDMAIGKSIKRVLLTRLKNISRLISFGTHLHHRYKRSEWHHHKNQRRWQKNILQKPIEAILAQLVTYTNFMSRDNVFEKAYGRMWGMLRQKQNKQIRISVTQASKIISLLHELRVIVLNI